MEVIMSNLAKGALIMALAFWLYWRKFRSRMQEVTNTLLAGHFLMLISIILEIAAFFMELLQPEGGPSILMMVAGLIVFSVGTAFFGGLGG